MPGSALLEFEGRSTWIDLESSSDGVLHISLAMLTALGLEFDRAAGELQSCEFLLPSIFEV